MKAKTTGKSVTCLIALLIVLSGTMVLHWNVRAEERIEGSIEGIINADDGSKIPAGFIVQLDQLSQDEIITTLTQEGGYFQFPNVDVGHYQLIVPTQTHSRRAYFSTSTGIFEVTEDETIFRSINVETRRLEYRINGNVTDEDGDPVSDAVISLSYGDYYTSSTDVRMSDNDTADYEIRAFNETFYIKAEAEGYATYITRIDGIEEDTTMDIMLLDSHTPMVSGYLWTEEDGKEKAVTTAAEVTLINNTDKSDILRNTMPEGNPWFKIDAVPGDYTLVVSAQGYMPYINTTVVIGDDNIPFDIIYVNRSSDEYISTNIEFDDWDTIDVTRERTLHSNSRIMGLDHWYVGNLAMQVDMAFGNWDMVLDQTELDEFKAWLNFTEANIPTTQNLISVNGIPYELDSFDPDFVGLDTLLGDVTDESMDITVTSTMTYTTEHVFEEDYLLDVTVMNDRIFGNHQDYEYTMILPEGYKRVSSNKEVIPSGVAVSGYLTITMDPELGKGKSHLTFDVREIETGEVVVTMDEGAYAYRTDDETYIVKQDANVTFIAEFWHPFGEDAENYTWSINDKYGEEITTSFATQGEFEVSVTVTDTAGLEVSNSTTVMVDGSGPTGAIVADNTTVDEGQLIEFSAYEFEDDSEIRDYEWNFSDGSYAMGMNVSHSFSLYGEYEVSLNITDRLGNWNVETIDITVHDVTDPVARFVVKYDDVVEESQNISVLRIERNQEITLDASKSYDPAGVDEVEGNVNVMWWITGAEDFGSEDVSITNQTLFTTVGTHTITLNVTDTAGNYQNISRTVEVTPGPTPNLEVTEITMSTEDIVSGKTVKVIANVTNYGTANATDISLSFKVDGNVRTVSAKFYTSMKEEASNEVIPQGEYRLIKFDWTPDSDGTKTLTVNATDDMEPTAWQYDNELELEVTVNPPAWRKYIGYIVLPVVIIVVTVGMYFYKDKIQAMLKKKEE